MTALSPTRLDQSPVARRAARSGGPTDRRSAASARAIAARDRILSLALTTYAVLWVIEGAVRKWVPGTESVFYLIRDGLLVGALIYAALIAPTRIRREVGVAFWGIAFSLTALGLLQALVHDIPALVPLVGLRNILAPLLPIYIVLRYRPPNVWRNTTVVILAFAPVEAVLAALQASSPANAIVNKQLGDDGASFTTAFGVVRASGTFSSPSGLTRYVAILLALSLAGLSRLGIKTPLVYAGLVSSVLILALSGSRGALLYAGVVAVGWLLFLVASPGSRKAIGGVISTVGLTFLLAVLAFPKVVNAFFVRLQTASDSDAVDERLAGSAFGFLDHVSTIFGDGLGIHGNAGIRLGSGGAWIEDENTRLVAELGLIGYAILLLRFVLAAVVIFVLVTRASRYSPVVSTTGTLVVYALVVGGITTQPTSQGYFALIVVVTLSALYDGAWGPSHQGSLGDRRNRRRYRSFV